MQVENFPGFPEGITGPDLMDRMRQQAERWGAELITEDVEHVDLSVRPFELRSSERTVKAHLTSAFARIGVVDRTQAAVWAQRHEI